MPLKHDIIILMEEIAMNVEYVNDNGYIVETKQAVYVFDYVDGMLPGHYLRQKKPLVFLVTIDHPRHFSQGIFSYDKTIIVPYDMGFTPFRKVFMMEPHEMIHLGFAKIHSFPTLGKGVSYLIEEEDHKVFYAGNLNLWQYKERKKDSTIKKAREAFRDIVKEVISFAPLDALIFPVNPEIGDDYDEGARYAIVALSPRKFFPTQFEELSNIKSFMKWAKEFPDTGFYFPLHKNKKYEEV